MGFNWPAPQRYSNKGGYTFKGFLSNIYYTVYHDEEIRIEDFHLDKVHKLTYLETRKLKGSFECRFLYGIYDKDVNKGWIRYHGLPIEEFYIEIGMQEPNYYEGVIGYKKGVYTDMKSRYRWYFIKNNGKFKYNESGELLPTKELYYSLSHLGATTKFIKDILVGARFDWRGSDSYRKVFFSQLGLLKGLLKDEEKEKLRYYPTQDVNEEYLEKFGYSPEEKYIENYFETFEYLGVENRVLFWCGSEYSKKIGTKANLEKRKELVYSKFKELFPNDKLDG